MNRVIIRTLGTCVAIFAGAIPRILRAADYNVDGMVNHAKYTGIETAATVSGFFVNTVAFNHFNCTRSGDYLVCDGWFPNTTCYEHVIGTGTGTGTGITPGPDVTESYAEYSMRCEWYKCMQDHGGTRIEGCSGNSKCNDTGVYCSNSGFFDNIKQNGADTTSYWNYERASWAGPITMRKYYFAGCDTGWYQNNSGAPCNDTSFLTGEPQFGGCCTACPGLKNFNAETSSGVTYVHGMDINATGGYSWQSNGFGITSCVAYTPQTTYSDTAGTYSLASGCPYTL